MQMWQKSIKSDKNDANVTKIDQMTQKSIKWHKNRCNDTKKIITQQKKSSRNKKIITQKNFIAQKNQSHVIVAASHITHHTHINHHTHALEVMMRSGVQNRCGQGGSYGSGQGGVRRVSRGVQIDQNPVQNRSKVPSGRKIDQKTIKLNGFLWFGRSRFIVFPALHFSIFIKKGGEKGDGAGRSITKSLDFASDFSRCSPKTETIFKKTGFVHAFFPVCARKRPVRYPPLFFET